MWYDLNISLIFKLILTPWKNKSFFLLYHTPDGQIPTLITNKQWWVSISYSLLRSQREKCQINQPMEEQRDKKQNKELFHIHLYRGDKRLVRTSWSYNCSLNFIKHDNKRWTKASLGNILLLVQYSYKQKIQYDITTYKTSSTQCVTYPLNQ